MSIRCVLFVISIVLFIDYSVANLLQVGSRCVPTSTVQGPCHDCVCSIDGVYNCKRRQCYPVDYENTKPKEDCRPNYLYREDKNFCICNDAGYWRSDSCQERFKFLLPKTSSLHYELRTNVMCSPGDLYIIDCNVCRCDASGFIDVTACTNRICAPGHKADTCNIGDVLRIDDEICACSDINFYIDRLCINIEKRPVQQVSESELSKLVEVGISWKRVDDMLYGICDSDVIYSVDCNKCVCTEGHLACTTNTCALRNKNVLRQRKSDEKNQNEFESLPKLYNLKDKCIPGKRYRFKCNVCHCMSDGYPSCGTVMCLENYVLDQDALRGVLSSN